MMLRLRQENDLLLSSISLYFHMEIDSRMNMREKFKGMADFNTSFNYLAMADFESVAIALCA